MQYLPRRGFRLENTEGIALAIAFAAIMLFVAYRLYRYLAIAAAFRRTEAECPKRRIINLGKLKPSSIFRSCFCARFAENKSFGLLINEDLPTFAGPHDLPAFYLKGLCIRSRELCSLVLAELDCLYDFGHAFGLLS